MNAVLEHFNVACHEAEIAAIPQWRIDELARKYASPDAYEPDEVDE